jgi:hypothetical protein
MNDPRFGRAAMQRVSASAPGFRAWSQRPDIAEQFDFDPDLHFMQAYAFGQYVLDELLFPPNEAMLLAVSREFEGLLLAGDDYVVNLVTIGFFEGLQNNMLHRGLTLDLFRPYLGPLGQKQWDAVIDFWNPGTSVRSRGTGQ